MLTKLAANILSSVFVVFLYTLFYWLLFDKDYDDDNDDNA